MFKLKALHLSILLLLVFTFSSSAYAQIFEGCVGSLQWNADDTLLAGVCVDGRLDILDLETGQTFTLVTDNSTPIAHFVWHPILRGILAYTTSNETEITIWNLDANAAVHVLTNNRTVLSLAWSPDGSRLAVGDGELWNLSRSMGTFKVWDMTSTPEVIYTSLDYSDYVSRVLWQGDGNQLAAEIRNENDSHVEVYDFTHDTTQIIIGDSFETEGDAGEVFTARNPIELLGWDYSSDWFVTTSLDKVQIRNGIDYQLTAEYSVGVRINDANINPHNSLIALALRGRVVILDIETGEWVQIVELDRDITVDVAVWSHDGTRIAYNGDGITIMDTSY